MLRRKGLLLIYINIVQLCLGVVLGFDRILVAKVPKDTDRQACKQKLVSCIYNCVNRDLESKLDEKTKQVKFRIPKPNKDEFDDISAEDGKNQANKYKICRKNCIRLKSCLADFKNDYRPLYVTCTQAYLNYSTNQCTQEDNSKFLDKKSQYFKLQQNTSKIPFLTVCYKKFRDNNQHSSECLIPTILLKWDNVIMLAHFQAIESFINPSNRDWKKIYEEFDKRIA